MTLQTAAQPAPRPWHSSTLLRATAAAHVGALGAVLVQPATLPWAAGGVIASHLLIAGAGLWPRSTLLGPNLLRLPPQADGCIALTFDDGPDPDMTPRVLDWLARHDLRATFFCIGARAERHPELVREIARAGHAVENHSQRHSHRFSVSGPGWMLAEIQGAQEVLGELAGVPPLFFRAPAGLRNPFLEPALCKLGLRLASWTRRGFDTLPNARPERIAARLLRGLAARDILLLHDGHGGHMADGAPVLPEVLPHVLEAVQRTGLRCVTLRDAVGLPAAGTGPAA